MEETASVEALEEELVRLLHLIKVERAAGQYALAEILTERAAKRLVKLAGQHRLPGAHPGP